MEFLSDYEKVCAEKGLNPQLPDVASMLPSLQNYAIAAHKLEIITDYNNNGWKANMADTNQYKYHPLFEVIADSSHPSGFRLVYRDYVYACDYAYLGARHACCSEELAQFMGEHCAELYEQLFM